MNGQTRFSAQDFFETRTQLLGRTMMNLAEIYPAFSAWLQTEDEVFRRYALLASRLKSFVLDHVLKDPDFSAVVAQRFGDVLRNCNTLDYDAEGVVEAYAILHFLDRFHRFQLVLLELLKQGLLPLRTLPIDVLDVGTGPAPTLFALSDIYSSLRRFGRETADEALANLKVHFDCAESSLGFRNWMHHFTEHANSRFHEADVDQSHEEWNVPYGAGTFYDFQGVDFQQEKTAYFEFLIRQVERDYEQTEEAVPSRQFIIDHHLPQEWKNAFRYDLIVLSNFLTEIRQVEALTGVLRSMGFALRNHGTVIVMGARGGEYQEIYARIEESLCSGRYQKKHSISKLTEIDLGVTDMEYSLGDRYGDLTPRFLS